MSLYIDLVASEKLGNRVSIKNKDDEMKLQEVYPGLGPSARLERESLAEELQEVQVRPVAARPAGHWERLLLCGF